MRRRNAGSYGFEDAQRSTKAFYATIPDTALHYDEVFAGDRVVARATSTNTGPLFGIPATNEPVELQVTDIACVENGEIAER